MPVIAPARWRRRKTRHSSDRESRKGFRFRFRTAPAARSLRPFSRSPPDRRTSVVLTGATTIASSAPALYSANADGAGVAAADALLVTTSPYAVSTASQTVYTCSPPAVRRCLPSPLSLSAPAGSALSTPLCRALWHGNPRSRLSPGFRGRTKRARALRRAVVLCRTRSGKHLNSAESRRRRRRAGVPHRRWGRLQRRRTEPGMIHEPLHYACLRIVRRKIIEEYRAKNQFAGAVDCNAEGIVAECGWAVF